MVTSNTLDFYVRMKDFMSAPLMKAGQTASSTFKLIQNNIKTTEKETEFLTKSVGELRHELREVNKVRFGTVLASEFKTATVAAKDLQRQIAVVQGTVPGSRGGGRLGMGGGLLSGARSLLPVMGVAGVVAGAGALMKSSVLSSMDFETKAKTFEVLTRSKSVGNRLADDLRKDSVQLGAGVYGNAQTLMGYGIGGKDVRSTLRMIGDVGMGDAEKMRSLALAIGQVNAAGKLTGQEMIQFVNAGFNPLQQMSETTGKSFSLLKKDMEKGNITFEMVMNSFRDATSEGGRFNNMLVQIGQTSAGQASKLKSQWENFKIDLGNTLTPFATALLGVANNTLQGLKQQFSTPQSKVFGTERGNITALLNTATTMPAGSGRTAILNQLSRQFPDQFGHMNLNGKSNTELATLSQKVNQEYGVKIAGQSAREQLVFTNSSVKRLSEHIGDINNRKAVLAAGYKDQALRGSGLEDIFGRLPSSDRANTQFGHLLDSFKPQLITAVAKSEQLEKQRARAEYFERAMNFANLANNPTALSEALGGNKKKMAAFSSLANKHITYGAGGWKSTATEGILGTLEGMLNKGAPAGMADDGMGSGGMAGGVSNSDVARQITGSGPRQINISGVKFAETVHISGGTAGEARENAQEWFNEMFLRLLQSGARVQS